MTDEMPKLENKISYCESPTFAFARLLREKGYRLADVTGVEIRNLSNGCRVGVLEPRLPISRRFLWFNWHKGERALFIGWFEVKRQEDEERWIVTVYGRDKVPQWKELMMELLEVVSAEVRVELKLGSEESRREAYLQNWGD